MRYFFNIITKRFDQIEMYSITQGFMIHCEKMFFYDFSGKDRNLIIIS
jgi:hypothetical protein